MRATQFPTDGITLQGIQKFIKHHGGKKVFQGLKTSEVCEKFVKPSTSNFQDSFCYSVSTSTEYQNEIKKATAFVSHAWNHYFLEMVESLRLYEEKQESVSVFWVDLFSYNQHKKEEKDFKWWQTVLKDNIGLIKTTLLVLDFEDPKPLKRAWCLWELISTIQTKANFHVIMSEEKREALENKLLQDPNFVLNRITDINVEKSEAFLNSDKEGIFEAVKKIGNMDETNEKVADLMKNWIVNTGKEVVGKVTQQQSSFLKDVLKRLIAREDPEELRSLSNIGEEYYLKNMFKEAEPYFCDALEGRRKVLGKEHPDTLKSLNNMANILAAKGKYQKAEELYKEALEGRKKVLGDSHFDTLVSKHSLAEFYYSQGKYNEAEKLYQEALEGMRKILGNTYPDIFIYITNLATLFYSQGRNYEAEQLFREAMNGSVNALGNEHPQSLMATCWMGELCKTMGKYDEAEKYFKQSLEIYKKTSGAEASHKVTEIEKILISIEEKKKEKVNSIETKSQTCKKKNFERKRIYKRRCIIS